MFLRLVSQKDEKTNGIRFVVIAIESFEDWHLGNDFTLPKKTPPLLYIHTCNLAYVLQYSMYISQTGSYFLVFEL